MEYQVAQPQLPRKVRNQLIQQILPLHHVPALDPLHCAVIQHQLIILCYLQQSLWNQDLQVCVKLFRQLAIRPQLALMPNLLPLMNH